MSTELMPREGTVELSPEEQLRMEHIKMHEKHRGHESMHAEMLLILLVTLIIAQIILVEWKKRHYKSYQFITLIAMWVIPLILCIRNQWWRFIFLWQLFSCITGLVVRKAIQRPITGTTPRLVYKWFYFIYRLSYILGIIGYIIMLATFFGFNLAFDVKPHVWMDCGLLFVFYGLYFGVLGRDIAEICADKMAAHIGYYTPGGMPTRTLEPGVCAVCGNKLLVSENEEGLIEDTYKLTCDHVFHEFCIRGWCIIGKKQTCPYCKEKVDLKKMFRNPWERPHVLYGQLLDWIRWLVAWQPLILFLVQGINWALGLENKTVDGRWSYLLLSNHKIPLTLSTHVGCHVCVCVCRSDVQRALPLVSSNLNVHKLLDTKWLIRSNCMKRKYLDPNTRLEKLPLRNNLSQM